MHFIKVSALAALVAASGVAASPHPNDELSARDAAPEAHADGEDALLQTREADADADPEPLDLEDEVSFLLAR